MNNFAHFLLGVITGIVISFAVIIGTISYIGGEINRRQLDKKL